MSQISTCSIDARNYVSDVCVQCENVCRQVETWKNICTASSSLMASTRTWNSRTSWWHVIYCVALSVIKHQQVLNWYLTLSGLVSSERCAFPRCDSWTSLTWRTDFFRYWFRTRVCQQHSNTDKALGHVCFVCSISSMTLTLVTTSDIEHGSVCGGVATMLKAPCCRRRGGPLPPKIRSDPSKNKECPLPNSMSSSTKSLLLVLLLFVRQWY